MNGMGSLWDEAPTPPDPEPVDESLDARFREFHLKNPRVFQRLKAMALKIVARGHKHYSVKTLIEVLRWEHDIKRVEGEEYLINNSYASRYARMLAASDPRLASLFAFRVMHSRKDSHA